MLSLVHEEVYETTTMGALFDELDFSATSPVTEPDGDSNMRNQWAIEVKSLDTYYAIEAFRLTPIENTVIVSLDSGETLEASPDHVVLQQDPSCWQKLRELSVGDVLVTPRGPSRIREIRPSGNPAQRLYDLQVAIAHSYYTNDIMSHNSHFLVMLGANALRMGCNVLHYTFELSEAKVGIRYDSNLCDIDSSDIVENKEKVKQYYDGAKELGRLKIKLFPTNSATIYTLKAHIEKLALKGFRPDLVLIDYADIMRSTRQYDSLRHELKLIYEELRGYAEELGVPIWTASQSNKEGADNEIVDLGNMSEAYGKAFIADVVLSISRRANEKSSGAGRLYVAKNRAGRDGIIYGAKIDTARSKFEILQDNISHAEVATENEDDFKKALQKKWNKVKGDDEIGAKKLLLEDKVK